MSDGKKSKAVQAKESNEALLENALKEISPTLLQIYNWYTGQIDKVNAERAYFSRLKKPKLREFIYALHLSIKANPVDIISKNGKVQSGEKNFIYSIKYYVNHKPTNEIPPREAILAILKKQYINLKNPEKYAENIRQEIFNYKLQHSLVLPYMLQAKQATKDQKGLAAKDKKMSGAILALQNNWPAIFREFSNNLSLEVEIDKGLKKELDKLQGMFKNTIYKELRELKSPAGEEFAKLSPESRSKIVQYPTEEIDAVKTPREERIEIVQASTFLFLFAAEAKNVHMQITAALAIYTVLLNDPKIVEDKGLNPYIKLLNDFKTNGGGRETNEISKKLCDNLLKAIAELNILSKKDNATKNMYAKLELKQPEPQKEGWPKLPGSKRPYTPSFVEPERPSKTSTHSLSSKAKVTEEQED